MKKKIFLPLFVLLSVFIFGQAPVDIFDPFYDDLSLWKNLGLINDAPEVRPYPLQEIERILNIVIEKGTVNQVRRATEYKNRFFGNIFHFGGQVGLGIGGENIKKQLLLAPLVDMNLRLHKILTSSASVSFAATKLLPKEEPKPSFIFSKYDIADDCVEAGSFKVLPLINSSVTVGTPEYYFTAGMARTSFGPFSEDNIIIGEQGFHSGQFLFIVNKEKFTYNQIFLTLSATDDSGGSIQPKKFLSGHSLNYRPLPWLSFGLFDFIVYGGRLEPIYFLPLSLFFVGQSIYDFPDNSILGLTTTIKPIKGMKIALTLLADDLGFNEIIKFKEAKWRMSGQFGISYTMPKDHWFTMADLSYTIVMPYCYSHVGNFDKNQPNYQNYTHNGITLGSNLPPNSDRLKLKLKFRPLYGMDIDFHNTFIRHANISESIDDIEILKDYFAKDYTTDGSILNHPTVTKENENGTTRNKTHAFLYSTPFLKQQTIQYINQTGLDLSFHFPILKSGGNMQFKLGYVFEANINAGINRNIFIQNKTDFENWNDKEMESLTPAEKQKIIDEKNRQLKIWREKATGKQFNHFLTISVKIAY